MPVVPQVDVDRAGRLGDEHEQVDTEADGDYERAHGGVVGHGCGCGPAHVEHLELEVIDIDHLVERRAECRGEQGGDDGEADEADTHLEARLERLAELDAYAEAENGEDDGHHHRGPQADDV